MHGPSTQAGQGSGGRGSTSGASDARNNNSNSSSSSVGGGRQGGGDGGDDSAIIDRSYRYKGKKWFDLENPAAEPLYMRVRREAAEAAEARPQTLFARGMSAGVPVASFQDELRAPPATASTRFPRLHHSAPRQPSPGGTRRRRGSNHGSRSGSRDGQRDSGRPGSKQSPRQVKIPKPSFSSPGLAALGSSFATVREVRSHTQLPRRTQARIDGRSSQLMDTLKETSRVPVWASRKEQERVARLQAEEEARRLAQEEAAESFEEALKRRKIAALQLFERSARRWYFDQLMLAFSHWVDFMELVRLREQEEREAVERFDNEFPDAPHSRAKVVLRDMLGLVDKLMNSKLRANWEFLEYGFKVHDWKLTPHQLDALLRSFDGISQFRESQVQRVLFRNGISGFRRRSDADVQRDRSEMATAARAKGLSPDPDEIETAVLKTEALAPNGESPPATISWAEFCQHMGRRIRDGDDAFSSENKARPLVLDFDVGAASGHAVAAGKPRSKAAGAFVLPANRPDEVLKELSAKSMKRMASFSHRHKSAVAHEFQSSKMSLRQWEQVALKAVVDKVYSQTAGTFQRSMRGWFVRNKLMEKNRTERSIHFFAIHWMNRVAAYFVGWRQQASKQIELRRYCWPKVRAWRAFVVVQAHRRELFRLCFWPFHTWRRETWSNSLARDKARFLKRVRHEVLKVRHLRAWSRLLFARKERREKVRRCRQMHSYRWARRVLHEWKRIADASQTVLGILKSRQRAFGSFLKCCFLALKYHAVGRKLVEVSGLRYRRVLPNAFEVDRIRVLRAKRRDRRHHHQPARIGTLGDALVEGSNEDEFDSSSSSGSISDDGMAVEDMEVSNSNNDSGSPRGVDGTNYGETVVDVPAAREARRKARREAKAAKRADRKEAQARRNRDKRDKNQLSLGQRAFYGTGELGAADARLVISAAHIAETGLPAFPTPTQLKLVNTTHGTNTEQAEMIDWVCRPMTVLFRNQVMLRAKAFWHIGRIVLPEAFRQWVRGTDLSRKDRFVAYRGYLVNVRHMFRKWQAGAAAVKQERQFFREEQLLDPSERFARRKQRARQRVEEFLDDWDDRNDWREAGIEKYNMLQSKVRKARRNRVLRLKKLQAACKVQTQTFAQRADIGREIIDNKSNQNRALREILANVGVQLKSDRAIIMHDTMFKVFTDVDRASTLTWKKRCFNRLVLVVRQKHALPRHKQARVKNWLSICARLRYLYRVMPEYHRMRRKWRVWCAWLRFIELKYQNETPGLNEEVVRRRELGRMFHRTLQRLLPMQAFAGGSALYVEDTTARNGLFSLEGAMARWSEFTQLSICRRRMLRLVHLLREHRIKRTVFMSLKIGLRTARLTHSEAAEIGHSINRDTRFRRKHVRSVHPDHSGENYDHLRKQSSGALLPHQERQKRKRERQRRGGLRRGASSGLGSAGNASSPSSAAAMAVGGTDAGYLAELADQIDENVWFDSSAHGDWDSDSDEDEFHAHAAASAAATTLLPRDSFYSRRLRADLDKWRTKFFASYHRSKPYMYRRERAKMQRQMHLAVTHGTPIMKRLLQIQREDVHRRVKHEQKLLCNAFRDRLKQRWDDFCVQGVWPSHAFGEDNDASFVHGVGHRTSAIAALGAGNFDGGSGDGDDDGSIAEASDLAITTETVEPFVEAGFPREGALLSVIVFFDENGVHGVARTVDVPGIGVESGEVHGNARGTRDVFEIGANDCLSAMEGYVVTPDQARADYTAAGIARLRFHTLRGRQSPWFGVRPPARPGTFFYFDATAETAKYDNAAAAAEAATHEAANAPQDEGAGSGSESVTDDDESARPGTGASHALGHVSSGGSGLDAAERASRPANRKLSAAQVALAPRIIGFCGRKSENKLATLGILVQRKLAPNVFGNCWVNTKAVSEQARAQHDLKAENDFAIVLRMRGSYVLDLLKRSQCLAKKMRATKTRAPLPIGEVRIAFQFSRWYFEALTFGLVRVPTPEEEATANEFTTRGMGLLAQGNRKVQAAEAIFRELAEFSSTPGKVTLDPAVLGAHKVLELNTKMSEAQVLKAEGQVLRADGQDLLRQSDVLLPSEPPNRKTLRAHFENLAKLAHTVNSFDKDEYDSAL